MKPLPDLRRLALVAVALALATSAQVLLTSGGSVLDGAIVYLVAAGVFVSAVRGVEVPPFALDLPQVRGLGEMLISRRGIVLLLGVALAVELLALLRFNSDSDLAAWALHVGSLLLLILGALRWEGRSLRPRLRQSWSRLTQLPGEPVLLLALFALALSPRVAGLGSQPFGIHFDEALNGLEALKGVESGTYPAYLEIFEGRGAMYSYLAAPALRVFGTHAGSLRLVSAFAGALTVPVAYLLFRRFFGAGVAVFGALLLAFSRWHINFSRIAYETVLQGLFVVLVSLLLWRALDRGRATGFVWVGVVLGAGLFTAHAFRLVPLAIVLFFILLWRGDRHRWRAYLIALAVVSASAFWTAGPLGLYALQNPDTFLKRVQSTSILARRDAPDIPTALLHNVGAHLGMFHVQGDRNGRHNLPGEPMLDPATGVLFALGLAAGIRQARDPRNQWFLLLFLAMLSAGILSVDFEAPQGQRVFGVIPASYFFVCVAADRMRSLYLEDLAPRWRQGTMVVAGLALVFIAGHNGYTYFVRQARDFASWNAFSTAQTIVAREMARLGSGVEFYVSNHFSGHPTLRFLAPEAGEFRVWREGDHLPIPEGGPIGAALYLDPRRESEFLRAQEWYPNAEAEMVRPPFGGPPVLYRVLLSPGDLSGPQGLAARYLLVEIVEGPDEPAISRREGPIDFDWLADSPLSEPFLVRWEGTLRAPVYGSYRLALEAPGEAEIWLDSATLVSGSGRLEADVTLAQGLHPIAIEAVSGPGPLRLSWQRPDGDQIETVPISALYAPPVRAEGLLGRYFSNADWAGPPSLERIDPDLSIYWQEIPRPRPYTVEWAGMVLAPSDGVYEFATDSKDGSTLTVAGQIVVQNPGGGRISGTAPLHAGLHPISLRYLDETHHTFVVLYWTPPGGGSEVIPSTYLLPPRESYPPLETLLAELGIAPPPSVVPLEIEVQASWGGFDEETPFDDPRAVAVGGDGTVYVLDTALMRVGRFGPQGRLLGTWSDPEWVEPADIAIDGTGNLYLVDAGLEGVLVYDRDGNRRAIWGAEFGLFRPRGIGLGANELLVADTGGARLVRISLDGALLGEIPIPAGLEGQVAQPTDAAVDGEGRIYVPDPENQRLHVLEPTGRLIRSWPIPRSDTVRAAHLSVGSDGAVYFTDPGGGRVLRFDAEGRLRSEISLPRSEDEELPRPVGVAVSADGTVYVADPGSRAVWVLEPTF